MGSPEILVVGSVAYDTVATPEGEQKEQLGGSATYFSVSASFFSRIGLVAVVGKDFHDTDVAMLSDHKVDVSGLQRVEGATFRWSGSYVDDLNTAVTLDTQLNVFAEFQPHLQPAHQAAPYLFLANIDPKLQHSVLDQMSERPTVVACDTMNLWIENSREDLVELIKKADVLTINEAEAAQLTGKSALVSAASALLEYGPKAVVIKRGEYGAVVFHQSFIFAAPAYPLAKVVDPTGAGDSFAAGFMGYLAATGSTADPGDAEAIRRAAIVGSVMASFAVEGFGLDKLRSITHEQIENRFTDFVELTRFHPLGGGQGLPRPIPA